MAADLGGAKVIATVGNHDIDTQALHLPNGVADGILEHCQDHPVQSPDARRQYWDTRVTETLGPTWRVVVVNSTVMRRLAAGERDTGLLDDRALACVKACFPGPPRQVNVLLCHHHPMKWPRLNPTDYSEMIQGPDLVQALDDDGSGWMVIHGHRHQPYLEYLPGGGDATVRLACGSVGARLDGELAGHVRNQVHMVEFHLDAATKLGWSTAGRVTSHTWRPTTGWELAAAGDGLPAKAGFGLKASPAALARRLADHLAASNVPALERDEMLAVEPGLPYMLPPDARKLAKELEQHHRGLLSFDAEGELDRLRLRVI